MATDRITRSTVLTFQYNLLKSLILLPCQYCGVYMPIDLYGAATFEHVKAFMPVHQTPRGLGLFW